jgi:hypothetical protein
MKKFTVSVLAIAILVSLLGSCASVSGGPANFVTYEGNLMVADVRYERLVFANESLGDVSVGANAYAGKYALGDLSANDLSTQGVNVFARYYPFGKSFFAGLGLGTAIQLGRFGKDNYDVTSFLSIAVVPELGWKIDIGEEGKFFIQPGLKVPFISGEMRYREKDKNGNFTWHGFNELHENSLSYIIYPYFGIGYAF